MMDTFSVLMEIARERHSQIERGFDQEHDDKHPVTDMAWLLARRANDLQTPNWPEISPEEPRRLAVEICAIAVALIESIDRRALDVETEMPREADPIDTVPREASGHVVWSNYKHTYVPFDADPAALCVRCEQAQTATIHNDS
jgi:hypothetical protein